MTRTRPVVPEPTANYPAQEHVEMKRQVEEKFNPAVAGEIADGWKAVGRQLTELAVDFSIIVNGSQAGWTGVAAEGARKALAKVGSFSDATGEHFTSTGVALQHQTTAAAEAKTRMPPPVEYDPRKMFADALRSGSVVQVGALAFTVPVQWARSRAAKEEAVAVMRSRDDALRSATTALPQFAEMPAVTQEQGVAVAETRTSSVRAVDTSSRVGTTGVTGSEIAGNGVGGGVRDGTTSTSWTSPPTSTPSPPTSPQQPGGQTRPSQVGQPGIFPGLRPPTARDPRTGQPLVPGMAPNGRGGGTGAGGNRGERNAGGNSSGVRGAGGGSAGARGLGGSGAGGGSAGARGLGGSGAGGSGTGGAGRSGAPGGPASTGRPPLAGFGPTGSGAAHDVGGRGAAGRGQAGAAGGGGAGRGEGAEDQEHQAKYLVPTDEHFGDDRMVAPPVIGE